MKKNIIAIVSSIVLFACTKEKDNAPGCPITTEGLSGTYTEDDAGIVCAPSETADGTWQLHGHTLTSDGTLNGTVASFDCKTLVYYTDNAIKPGDRLTYTMEKQ